MSLIKQYSSTWSVIHTCVCMMSWINAPIVAKAVLTPTTLLCICISLLMCSSHPEETLTDERLENSSILRPFKMAIDWIVFRPVSRYLNWRWLIDICQGSFKAMFKSHLHCHLNKAQFRSDTHYLDCSACSVYHLDSVALHMLTVALGVVLYATKCWTNREDLPKLCVCKRLCNAVGVFLNKRQLF